KEDLLAPMSKDFFNQLFKSRMQQKSYTGEIHPGEEVKMNSVFSGQREKEEKLRAQVTMEKRLREEDQVIFSQKSQEFKPGHPIPLGSTEHFFHVAPALFSNPVKHGEIVP
ncbi:MAG: hypothetical protein UV59_C0018G0024, partial [Candidatus Gottesmanbacteria bacterium GW2011_GWA1_43_11]